MAEGLLCDAPLRIDTVLTDESALVAITGDLDISSVHGFIGALEAVAKLSVPLVIVDISGATFIGATGISALIRGRNSFRAEGRNLVVRSPTRIARKLFELCDLLDLVDGAAVIHQLRHDQMGDKRLSRS
jgi:anti-anti-sigma factor